ncbi:class I SAM-dependent methyltransferase [Gilvimarinus sp. F26214L]|uniref:class I SAM-dependent methyltransferase n=1 Tax=Gilvimarinus sp. DZF01 TaxID=3461371 RepID=UPI00404601FC
MTEQSNYFSSAPDHYRQFRPRYPRELFDYLADICPGRDRAWDCACGNGQATIALSRRFAQVSASDVSAAQIAQAEPCSNVHYSVSPAEPIDAPDATLDLVTVAQAIHWFDHSRFFPEVNRVLRPGGILAAWGYQLLYTDTGLDQCIARFHRDVLGPYWPSGRELLDEGYTAIDFPYPRLRAPDFYMRQKWNFRQLTGYLSTWSAVKRYREIQGVDPLQQVSAELQRAWGDAQVRAVHWPLILYVGRKPSS